MIGHFEQRLRTDVGRAGAVAFGKATHAEGGEHRAQIAALAAGDQPRQLPTGFGEERVGRVTAVGRCERCGGGLRERGVDPEAIEHFLAGAVIRQHRVGHDSRFAVAGPVGGHGQELVVPARFAGK